jgi:hypothetical protein
MDNGFVLVMRFSAVGLIMWNNSMAISRCRGGSGGSNNDLSIVWFYQLDRYLTAVGYACKAWLGLGGRKSCGQFFAYLLGVGTDFTRRGTGALIAWGRGRF